MCSEASQGRSAGPGCTSRSDIAVTCHQSLGFWLSSPRCPGQDTVDPSNRSCWVRCLPPLTRLSLTFGVGAAQNSRRAGGGQSPSCFPQGPGTQARALPQDRDVQPAAVLTSGDPGRDFVLSGRCTPSLHYGQLCTQPPVLSGARDTGNDTL